MVIVRCSLLANSWTDDNVLMKGEHKHQNNMSQRTVRFLDFIHTHSIQKLVCFILHVNGSGGYDRQPCS